VELVGVEWIRDDDVLVGSDMCLGGVGPVL